MEPKQSQTEPNGAETEPNGAETDRNRALSGGTAGGVCRGGGVGVVREKENHYTGVFRHILSLCRGFPLSHDEVRNLKNTVWKTPFGTRLRTFCPICVDLRGNQDGTSWISLQTDH